MGIEADYLNGVKQLVSVRMQAAILRQRGEDQDQDDILSQIQERKAALLRLEGKGAAEGSFIPLVYLKKLYTWSEFEQHVIELMTVYELDCQFPGLVVRLQGGGQGEVSPFLAYETFEYRMDESELAWCFKEDGMLARIMGRPLEWTYSHYGKFDMDPRMREFLLNGTVNYEAYHRFIKIWNKVEGLALLQDEQELLTVLKKLLKDADETNCLGICLYGPEGVGKKHYLKHLCSETDQNIVFVQLAALSQDSEKREGQLAAFIRECILLQAMPVLEIAEEKMGQEGKPSDSRGYLKVFMEQLSDWFPIVFMISQLPLQELPRTEAVEWITLEVKERSLAESMEIWEEQLGNYPVKEGLQAGRFANQFALTPGKIRTAIRTAYHCSRMQGKKAIDEEDLRRGCYALLEDHMDNRAARIRPSFGWDQLILPAEQKALLLSAWHRVNLRGKVLDSWGMKHTMAYGTGVSILLYGPPGTGKTMAAQVFARETGMELYRVQLAAVFNKYIGETEKNLQVVFDQAEKNHMILFFDEADILFGKRTEVSSSNDKYSNMETAYLLQRLEEYEGISILATNYYQNFDDAFKRRLQYIIEFPFPDEASRKEIWQKAFPPEMPAEGIDFDFLSRFELSGGNIKNIVLQAAFSAAGEEGAVNMNCVMTALRQEYLKSGRVLTEEEAGIYFDEMLIK